MSEDLLKRRIASRQRLKEAGGHTFTLRRPTEFEQVVFSGLRAIDYVSECTDACDLTEADLLEGGSAEIKVPFSRPLFRDWLQEHPELWSPLLSELRSMVEAHAKAKGETVKN